MAPAKLPFKVKDSFSFLAVHLIRVGKTNQIVIETDASAYEFEFLSLDDLEQVLIHMVTSLKKLFPDSSPENLLQHASPSLLVKIQWITNSSEELLKEKQGPCGGFSDTYAALCDYIGLPFQEEIQWHVDNNYHGQECREFNLLDFSHLHSQDLALSVTALSWNRWFTRLYCKDFKLNPNVVKQIINLLGKSAFLEELVLDNCGLKFDFAQEMAQVLSNHPDSVLNGINLSRNLLEDRGIIALSKIFEQCIKSPRSVNFAKTLITQKGITALCQSLASSGLFRSSLCQLDLSGNPGSLMTEGAGSLFSVLSQANALNYLDLSGTDCALDVIFDALASGCCENLIQLKLSKNVYSHKKNRDVPAAISDFFSKASALQLVSLSGTKLPPEALRAVLQGLAYNMHLSGLHLDLSSCELRSSGAQVIQDLVSDASCICDLNLSDNGFDCDIVTLVLALNRSRSIKHVALGKNFNIRSRAILADTLHRIVQLTHDEDCSIESISVAESRLKLGTSILLGGLGSSRNSLVFLDISGNAMGDVGAKILSKALSVNTTLRTLIWDRNNTTLGGFLDFMHALERNFTLKIMPLPLADVTQAYRGNPEKMEEVMHKIQSYLARNQIQESPAKERYLLQPITTASACEQAMKDACQDVQASIEMLRSVQDVEVKAEIQQAEEAIKDAKLSTNQILPILYKIRNILHLNSNHQQELKSLTEEVASTCFREIQAIVQAKLEAMYNLQPQILPTRFWDKLTHSLPEKAFLDQSVANLNGKLMEIQWSVTEAMAHAITDKTLEELTTIQGKLCNLATEWETSCSMSILPTPHESSSLDLDVKVEAEEKETGTLQTELSLSSRSSVKSRPASTKDAEVENRLFPSSSPASIQSLMDLPTAGGKLEHFTRDRPRPNRKNRQPPRKPNVQLSSRENDEDRSIARLDEGLDEFFTKKMIYEHLPPVSLETSLAAPLSTTSGSRTLKKKIGHFFAFKKPKSSWNIRPEKEPEGSPLAMRGRKSMLSDILRTYSKASESTKALSKSDEEGLAVEERSCLEHSQTPDSSRRVKPTYSREGKSQSLILLSGEDEERLDVPHEKKRSFERTDTGLPSSFEQRVHVMLHRIGVTKVNTFCSSESKKKQSKDGEIKKAGSDGDIVDSSTEAPCSLKSRTHSMSTDPSVRRDPTNIAGRIGAEPIGGSSEGRLSWKALGRQLNAELKGKCSELSCSPRRAFAAQEPASHREQKGREIWSSSLPRTGRSTPPLRRISDAGEGQPRAELQNSHPDVNVIAEDNQLKSKPRLKPVVNRRAMSVHEEQLRDQACVAELHHAKIPLCLHRSPILKWKSTPPQAKNVVAPESKLRPEMGEES